MSGTTSVPSPAFGPTGFIAPAEGDILTGVLADMNAAFGGNLAEGLSTPHGQLASSEAAIIGDKNNTFLFYTQQVDPAFAEGRMQDGIARIYFITRNPAQPTTVQADCVGAAGTIIPTGARASATDGNIYLCTAGGMIPVSGTIALPFSCSVTGPIACPAGALSTIYQTISGWDSITNPANGVLGNLVESRAAFEARRSASVAQNALGSVPAVRGAVLSVANVLDAFVVDNKSSAAQTISGVLIPPHSLFVSVAGGAPADIAAAILTKKAPGCDTYGNTTVSVPDTTYSAPQPSYAISYQIATETSVFFAVTMTNTNAIPSDALTQVQNAIIAAFAGADGGPRARIAQTIYASRYYGPIATLGSWAAAIVSIEIGTAAPNLFSLLLPADQVPTVAASNISLILA